VGREENTERDRDLVRRCQKGDDAAFEELVKLYQQTVFNVIYHNIGNRNDVEDIAQKVFAKIYFSLGKFDNKRPFFPWLYRIAINQCYDEMRHIKRRKIFTFTELSLDDGDQIEKLLSQTEQPSEFTDDKEKEHALLRKILNLLPEQQRTAIVLRDLEEVPYHQMAEVMKCTEQAARLKVFRARAKMRELLEKSLRRKSLTTRKTSKNNWDFVKPQCQVLTET
jgi:RNA polymerase sigma-70 factor (ECF subfamily)